MKKYWFDVFPKYNLIKERILEHRINDQVIDVYFVLRNGKKVAIECQNSKISCKKLIERTKNYSSKGIYVLWVFNGHGPCSPHKKNPRIEDKVDVSDIEKRVHRLYGNRVYYMNVQGKKIINKPYTLHFTQYFELKTSKYNFLPFKKYYRSYRSSVPIPFKYLKIICVDAKGYRLARIDDTHVIESCVKEINNSLKNFCRSPMFQSKRGIVKIPLDTVISPLKNTYGYYLPYLLLTKFRRIKKLGIEKVEIKKWKYKDCIVLQLSDYT